MVQVWPKNDTIRKLIKHPAIPAGFREEGSAEWPDDPFTLRRIEDGDVLLSDPNPPVEEKPTAEASADKEAPAKKK